MPAIVSAGLIGAVAVATAAVLPGAAAVGRQSKPNIVAIFGDDLGFFDTQIYNDAAPTPTMAKLAQEGLLLDRHYVFRYCSPTRRSFLSGRFPNRISTTQPDGDHLCSDFLPLNCTILSEKLAAGGYDNHFVGKGHLGYQTMDHLPVNRGFKSHVGFLSGSEAYSHGGGAADIHKGSHDLWQALGPAVDVVPGMDYATDYYGAQAVGIIDAAGAAWRRHAAAVQAGVASVEPNPFFMYLAIQNVHTPYTLPAPWEQHAYPQMWDHTYANMLAVMDAAVANVTAALHRASLWDDTLVLFTADNGGVGKGNNHPLRGHKHDPWEGGTRATAFLSGGLLPEHVRGTKSGDKLVHVSDWYPTFLHLAGIVASDNASFSGVHHDIDGVNVWPLLTGANNTQPRAVTATSEVAVIDTSEPGRWWKLVTLAGQSNYYFPNQTNVVPVNATLPCLDGAQPDPAQPGRTDPIVNGACVVCNDTAPCLFDLLADPNEEANVAAAHPDVVARLAALVSFYQDYYPGVGSLTPAELEAGYDKIDDPGKHWGNFLGPCYTRKNSSGGGDTGSTKARSGGAHSA